MNCIILLLLLFCGGNSCDNNNCCGSSNACGARRLEDAGCCGDRDRRPLRPDFPNFTPVDDPAFPEEMTGNVRPADVNRTPEIREDQKPSGCTFSLRAFLCFI